MNRMKMPYLARVVHSRPRLFVSILLGAAVVPFFPSAWPLLTRTLLGWDVAVGLYLTFSYYLMAKETVPQIRKRAALEDEGSILILVMTVAAALASLFAIILQLSVSTEGDRHPFQLIFAT